MTAAKLPPLVVDVIRSNLTQRAMLIKEPVIDKPTSPLRHLSYEQECREALKPHLEAMIDLAVKAGWDRNIASFSLMYLAAKRAAPLDRAA